MPDLEMDVVRAIRENPKHDAISIKHHRFSEYSLLAKAISDENEQAIYSGSVVKTKIQAFYNELIYVTR